MRVIEKRFYNLTNFLSTWLVVFFARLAGVQIVPLDYMVVPKGRATFDRKEAELIGLNEAIALEEMRSWTAWNERHSKRSHCNEGVWWLYNSPAEWKAKHFPWWSESTIRRVLDKLTTAGLATSATYEQGSSRRWWAVGKVESAPPNRKKHHQYELPFMQNDTPALQIASAAFQNDTHTGIESLQESSSSREGISKQQQDSPMPASAGATERTAAVAVFAGSQTPGNLPAPKASPEAAETIDREHQPLAGETAMQTGDIPPSSAPPPFSFPAWMAGFWTECTPAQLQEMLQKWGEPRLLAEHAYAQGKTKPAGFARWRLQNDMLPPPIVVAPDEPVTVAQDDVDTTPDAEPEGDAVDSAATRHWKAALDQLELQFDPATFNTWMRGAKLGAVDGCVYRVMVRNERAQHMLQSRLCRDVQRVLADVVGNPAVEIQFDVMGKAKVAA